MYECQHKYEKTDRGKETQKKYRHSKRGKVMAKKSMKKCYQRDKKTLKRLKINGCAICGYNECVACLDFHHINPQDKKFQVDLNGMSRRSDSIAEETNKCILLCKNCHAKIHYEELD